MSAVIDDGLLTPGFDNPVLDAQGCFTAAMRALSRPGQVVAMPVDLVGMAPPRPLHRATAALALTLLDADTPVWLDAQANSEAVRAFLRFHCSCPLVSEPAAAAFALIAQSADMPPLSRLAVGDDEYPDQSATAIIQLTALDGRPVASLTGPGVHGEQQVGLRGLPTDFVAQWHSNHALYPLGVDLFFTSGDEVMGLPRSTSWRSA